jgi:hypothetical protein
MHNDYLCTKCKGQLNVGDVLIFVSKVNDQKNGLLLLHPELGNYTVINHKVNWWSLHVPSVRKT